MLITTGKEAELKILPKGEELAAAPVGQGLIRLRRGCFRLRGSHQPWVHGGTWVQIGAFPPPAPSFQNSFPILCPLPSRRLSLESQLRHPIVLGWPLAGGWRPAAAVPAAAGSEPGLRAQGQRESSSVYLVLRLQPEGMLSLLFSPSLFFFFLPSLLSEELFALGLLASLLLLQPAIGICLLEGRRRGKQKAPGMPSPVI